MTDAQQIGVLIMAYGGPDALDEIPGYLADIRSGRPTTPQVLGEITRNYREIGGRSPLTALTLEQARAITEALNPAANPTANPAATPTRFATYVGMRHWAPWIEEQVGHMLDQGITRAVSVVLAPHYSCLSVAKYQAKIADGLDMYRGHIDFTHVDSYHDAPGLIDALAERVREGIARWPVDRRAAVHVVFSAHSLPVRIVAAGDPYPTQLHETAALVARAAGLADGQWSWSYQSAGRSPEPWLGPSLSEHLQAIAQRGIRDVVSVPVGFVCDHVEVLYDIDIDAQRIARELNMRLERPPSLNLDPRFIQQVASVIRNAAGNAGWLAG